MTLPANIAVNAERLWAAIMETARFGATAKGGVKRLTLTDEDKLVRDWFRAACEAAGCTVAIDDLGNMFARRPGRDNSLPPIAMGSHLDTQPTGGKFDGIIGVLSGLEVIRTLNDLQIETNAPIEVINWTNEEGSRFAPAMLCSGVFAGVFPRAYADSRVDREGKSFGDELDRIGYRGTEPVGARKLGAHFELHIEQGPILEAEGKTIGIVTGVQGMRWFEVTVGGAESHAGSTPMPLRHDAMLAAARMIVAVSEVAATFAPSAVGTVGLVECRPNSRNVVPGEVRFSVEFRHPSDAEVDVLDTEFPAAARAIADACGVTLDLTTLFKLPAQPFDAACVDLVRQGAAKLGYGTREIVSGAGHDAVYVARHVPTAMIFTPCKDGLSHNEAESIEPEEAEAGCQVLFEAVVARANRRL